MSVLRFPLMVVALLAAVQLPLVGSSSVHAADEPAAASDADLNPDLDHVGEPEHDELVLHGDEAHSEEAMPPILSYDPGAAVVNVLIFLGTFWILAKFVWPVILNGLKAREERIATDLREAQQANQQAEARLAEYEQKVAQAASEAKAMLAEARRDAEASAAKIIEEAKADAQRQADRALADIETAKKVALADIANQTSALAIGVAKQVVGRELKPEDHAELIRNALEQVPSNN
jgi:F-type H+-transporting ATPase subunit b